MLNPKPPLTPPLSGNDTYKIKACLDEQNKNKNANESVVEMYYNTCDESLSERQLFFKKFSFLQGNFLY